MSEKNKTKKHRQSQGTHKRACTSRTAGQRREIWLSQKKKKKVIREKYAGMISIRIYICFCCRVFAVGFYSLKRE